MSWQKHFTSVMPVSFLTLIKKSNEIKAVLLLLLYHNVCAVSHLGLSVLELQRELNVDL